MSGSTVSVYLSSEERAALERYEREEGTSRSFVIRTAIRLFLGLPVSRASRAELMERLAGQAD